MQVLKLFGGASLGGALGAGKWDLAKALGVDLLALAAGASNETSSTTRNLGSSILKGVLTQDKRKMLCEILGGIVAETVAAHAPATDENTKLEDRIFRALITNSDMQRYYVQKYVDQRFNTTKPAVADTDEAANSEAQKPTSKNDAVDIEETLKVKAKTQPQEAVDAVVKQLEELDRAIAVGQEHVANLQRQALDTHEASIALKAVTEQRSALIAQHPAVSPTKLTEDIFQERSVIDEMRYLELAAIEQRTQQLGLELDQAKSALAGHTQAVQDAAKKEQRLHEENKKTRLIPKPKLHEKWQKVQRKLAEKQQSLSAATQHVSALEEQLHAQAKAQLAASNPPIEVRQALSDLDQKDKQVSSSSRSVGAALDKYQEHGKKDKYHDKLKSKVKAHNANLQDRDAAYNKLQGLLSTEATTPIATPQLKTPPKASKMEKALLWANKNVVVSTYATHQPIGYGYGLAKPVALPSGRSIYQEGRHQVALESSALATSSVSSANGGNGYGSSSWAAVQQHEQEKLLATNIAYRSHKPKQQPPAAPRSILAVPSIVKGTGMAQNTQARSMQLAGFSPSTANAPTMPKQTQTQRNITTWIKAYIKQWKDDPLKAKRDMDLCLLMGAKKTIMLAIQAFEQPSLKNRPNTFGLMEVSDKLDSWFAKKVNIDLGSPNAQMSMFVGEFAMPLPILGGCKPCMKVGQEAFALMRQLRPQPLLDRSLALAATRDARVIRALENRALRCGFTGDSTVVQLAEKNVEIIKGGAYNRAAFERYKVLLRTKMEKPHVVDSNLIRYVDRIYRTKAQIGSGSTAAAIRYELKTGSKVSGRLHSYKGRNMIVTLEKWLKNNPNATHGDRAAAENIIKDIRNALGE